MLGPTLWLSKDIHRHQDCRRLLRVGAEVAHGAFDVGTPALLRDEVAGAQNEAFRDEVSKAVNSRQRMVNTAGRRHRAGAATGAQACHHKGATG